MRKLACKHPLFLFFRFGAQPNRESQTTRSGVIGHAVTGSSETCLNTLSLLTERSGHIKARSLRARLKCRRSLTVQIHIDKSFFLTYHKYYDSLRQIISSVTYILSPEKVPLLFSHLPDKTQSPAQMELRFPCRDW